MAEEITEYIPETIPEFELSTEVVPWLTEDKIDASISVRWLDAIKTYSWERIIGTTTDQTITVWFRPKYIFIDAFYTTPDIFASKSWSVENDDWTITVTAQYWTSSLVSLWSWSNTVVDAMHIEDTRTYAKIWVITDTWFTLVDINRNDTFTLQIYAEW
jgi:hypothetical protein